MTARLTEYETQLASAVAKTAALDKIKNQLQFDAETLAMQLEKVLHFIVVWQGRNHGWKVDGDQGLGPSTGALAPRARSKAGLGVEYRPLPLWGSGGITPGKFLKLRC